MNGPCQRFCLPSRTISVYRPFKTHVHRKVVRLRRKWGLPAACRTPIERSFVNDGRREQVFLVNQPFGFRVSLTVRRISQRRVPHLKWSHSETRGIVTRAAYTVSPTSCWLRVAPRQAGGRAGRWQTLGHGKNRRLFPSSHCHCITSLRPKQKRFDRLPELQGFVIGRFGEYQRLSRQPQGTTNVRHSTGHCLGGLPT
ncbi:hypothetical protein N658DRAFT_274651 [Parathielavia hyrcaniae]|uniref:Uncharacterized protein n=1 Tax=Parathielavia hyrcaniae TaxID=113614 RepID=A0AAN6Q4H9_9PEZI|nr:hypothetical protein N658DRAFT_274651 [Parathielavia hyrcaniae]